MKRGVRGGTHVCFSVDTHEFMPLVYISICIYTWIPCASLMSVVGWMIALLLNVLGFSALGLDWFWISFWFLVFGRGSDKGFPMALHEGSNANCYIFLIWFIHDFVCFKSRSRVICLMVFFAFCCLPSCWMDSMLTAYDLRLLLCIQ